jgi:hypothetical protein
MGNSISYIGAALSALAALAAWYFNHEMKKYELAQSRTTKVLDKQFECYPRVWELCQSFLMGLSSTGGMEQHHVDKFCSDLIELYQSDGLYYSERVQSEVEKVIADRSTLANAEGIAEQILTGRIRGNTRHAGILRSIKDDLGVYVASSASVLRGSD